MKMYKIKDIFNIANKQYNLKLDPKQNKVEIESIKRAIRRQLKKVNTKAENPLEVTQDQANYLINNIMNSYFLKQSAKRNPNLYRDKEEYNRMTSAKTPFNLSYQQAEIITKLNFIIWQLTDEKVIFDKHEFRKAYQNVLAHTDSNGYPLPGYTEAKEQLYKSNQFFNVLPASKESIKKDESESQRVLKEIANSKDFSNKNYKEERRIVFEWLKDHVGAFNLRAKGDIEALEEDWSSPYDEK